MTISGRGDGDLENFFIRIHKGKFNAIFAMTKLSTSPLSVRHQNITVVILGHG